MERVTFDFGVLTIVVDLRTDQVTLDRRAGAVYRMTVADFAATLDLVCQQLRGPAPAPAKK